MKEEADKKKAARTDAAGRSGFGASTAPLYWHKGDAEYNAGIKVLKSKGVDPMKYSNQTGMFKGQKPIYDYLEANTPKMKFLTGKSEGMKGLMKSGPDKAAYKRISTEIRGMDANGKVVPFPKPKKKK